eukprot:g8814.t1
MAATPCGCCGKAVSVRSTAPEPPAKCASRARSCFSGCGSCSSSVGKWWRREEEQLRAGGGGLDGGGEARRAGEQRARTRGDRAGGCIDNSRRSTTSSNRINARKRARSSARGRSGGAQRPLRFYLPPVGKGSTNSTSPCLAATGGGIKRGALGAWASRGRLAAAIAAAAFVVGSAQEDRGESVAESVAVPLASSGLQYTADVSILNSSATAALVVDTTVSIVAFPVCGSVFGEDTCVPYQDSQSSSWKCKDLEVDVGTVTLDHNQTRLVNQEVSLSGGVSTVGDVLAVFNKTTVSEDHSGTLEGWGGSAGVLGLAPFPNTDCLNGETPTNEDSDRSVFSRMIDTGQYFALDLGDEDYDSTLEIGGYSGASSGTVGDIQWGEENTARFPNTWGFSAFDLSVCGRGMMGNVTSFWPAVVSTGSACLGLPEEFFDSLMAWLPVTGDCLAQADGAPAGIMCSLASEDATEELPSLSFRLRHHGQQLYIPLSSLLLDAEEVVDEGEEIDEDESPESSDPDASTSTDGDRRLCITREASIRGSGWVFSMQPVVTLGTLPLRSLYTVVDTDLGRVGLAQKLREDASTAPGSAGNASCLPAAECVGMQSFQESVNACENPSCSSYFFTNLDEETMTCKSSGVMKTLAWVFGIFFGITEMAGHFLRAYYGATGVGLRGHQHHQGWEFHTGRLIESCLGKATRALGRTSHERSD